MFERIKAKLSLYYSKKLFRVCFYGVEDDEYDQKAIALASKYIKKGADVNYAMGDTVGFALPPFLCACRRNATELIRYLAIQGADVNVRTNNLENAIMVSLNYSFKPETLELLLSLGVDINAKNIKNETVLHKEAKRVSAAGIALILEAGANPNVLDRFGNTPLNCLLLSKNTLCKDVPKIKQGWYNNATLTCAELLLNAGANPNIANNNGENSLDIELNGATSRRIAYTLIKNGAVSTNKNFDMKGYVSQMQDLENYAKSTGEDNIDTI